MGEFYGPQNYFHLASALQNLGLQRDFLSALWESGAAHPGPSVGSAWSSCLLPSAPFSKQSSSLIRTFLGFCHHSSRNRSRFFIPGAETGSDGGRRVGLSRVSENLGAREGDRDPKAICSPRQGRSPSVVDGLLHPGPRFHPHALHKTFFLKELKFLVTWDVFKQQSADVDCRNGAIRSSSLK